MQNAIGRITRELPPSAVAAIALTAIFVLLSALAQVAARAPRSDRSQTLAVATPAPTLEPAPAPTATPLLSDDVRLPPLLPGIDRPTPRPRPTPEPAPLALGVAPQAGGILFRHCERLCSRPGVWRYDGATGTIQRVGVSAEPTADGRGYVVRQDDGRFVRVDAATGAAEPIAPLGATAADAAPAGSDLVSAYAEGAAWVLPRRGPARRVMSDVNVGTVRFSPDARLLALLVTLPGARAFTATEIWVLALPDGAPQRLVHADLVNMGPVLQLGPWSPDGMLLTYWEISTSGSMNADGVHLRAIDVRSGRTFDLGTTLSGPSRLTWKAPHTLAYVSGGSRMTWDHKIVRIWSPESGFTIVTASGVGLNPNWSADGSMLYLITADEHDYVPVDYFAGKNSGGRSLSVYDTTTKRITTLAPPGSSVYEGMRESRDGRHLLVMWRPTHVVRSLDELPAIPMTLGLFDRATGQATPLVRIAGDVGFGYYGSYDGPEGMAWSEGR